MSLNQARDIVAQLQAQQAQAMQQQQEAQQRAMQAMQAARRQGGPGPRGPGLMVPPTPSSPDQLPEPDFQLRPPGQ
ncbi:MAG: hypothetical protein U0326_10655 [Polyangiales bacterium]